jgi:23S rRNA pseudouridine1911/1915/1917 synthase
MSPSESVPEPQDLEVRPEEAGARLDVFLAHRLPHVSRAQLRRLIDAGAVRIHGAATKASHRLRSQQRVTLAPFDLPADRPVPEDIPLEILYDDEHLVAVNKPPGMVVHPAKGHWSGTLASALAFRFGQLSGASGPARPGIVHRLDRDTSGVIVAAKTDQAHLGLARQFEERRVKKTYLAIVAGVPDRDRDVVALRIGSHPRHREKMAIRKTSAASRAAETWYEVLERFDGFALLRVEPRTGRTHQIRVHLASVGLAVLCDRLYGGRARLTRGELMRPAQLDTDVLLARQALHAFRLALVHPISGKPLDFEAAMPDDMQRTLEALRRRGAE